MQLSNRLTFSLASLIILIAFGLVFGPVLVMADDGGVVDSNHGMMGHDSQDDANADYNDPNTHVHPEITSAKVVPVVADEQVAKDAIKTGGGETYVIPVNAAGTANAPTANATAAENTATHSVDGVVKVEVQFDYGVTGLSGVGTGTGDDITFTIRDAAGIAVTPAAISGITSSSDNKTHTFTLTFDYPDTGDAVTNENNPYNAAPFSVFLGMRVNRVTTSAYNRVTGGDYPASGNLTYTSRKIFTIVKAFDETGPTATITPSDTKFNKSGQAEFTVAFNEALKSLSAADFTIANGTATLSEDEDTDYTYILAVTPMDPNEGVKVTLKKNAIEDPIGNKGPSADVVSDAVVEDIKPAVVVSAAAALNKDDKAVFTLTFSEALSSSGFDAFGRGDLTITGGTAAAADLSKPVAGTDKDDLQPDQIYTLLVTPNADLMDGELVTVTVGSQIEDAAGNAIDLTRGTPSKSLAVDLNPPTVTITAPSAPLTGEETGNDEDDAGKLEFTFLFSEPINPTTFTASDIVGEDYVVTDAPKKDATHKPATGTNTELWTARVKPTDEDSVTLVLNVDAVADLVGRTLAAGAFATYTPPVDNTAPFFPKDAKVGNLPAGLCVGDSLPANVTLPLANDTEDERNLTYSLTMGTPAVAVPNAMRTEGFYWETTDAQTRILKGTATLADGGTYTWTVTDSHGASASFSFTIKVKALQIPEKITGLAAMKVESASLVSPTKNRVRLTWAAPAPKAAYPDCIPAPTGYTVTQMKFDRVAGTFGDTVTHPVAPASAVTARSFDLPELPTGIYQFTITATNSAGTGPASDAAVWDVTGGDRVVVADPPASPTDLDATIDSGSVTLDWLKVPDISDGGAPIYDNLVAATHADYAKQVKLRTDFYGSDVAMDAMKDFGGYVIYQTNERTAQVTRYPTSSGTLTTIGGGSTTAFNYTHPAFQVQVLPAGEYVFRVVAKNISGESADSHTATKRVVIVGTPPGTPNSAPDFGDATIASINATKGQAIAGRFLPEAKDANDDAGDLTYSIVDKSGTPTTTPGGLTFDPSTRALTGTPTAATAETAYTYKVTDPAGASDTIGFFITVKGAATGPGTGTPTTSLPAKGHVVFVRSLANAPVFGTANPMVAEWSAMPNLHQLFAEGGGGSLQLNVAGVNARQVVMSEVMWAVDEGKVSQPSYTGQQWIELYNNTDNAINISDISFVSKSGRPALAEGTDLISNVVGAGNDWIKAGKGQNGNSTAGSLKEFISMYRSNTGKEGWNPGHWTQSTLVYHPNHKGTPGKGEPSGPKVIGASGVALGTVFNEIANHPSGNSSHEWIELRKKGGDLSNLENWVVDMVTGVNAQTRLFKIPKLNDGRYDDILLITKTDPARDDSHPLRGGYNVEKSDADQANEGRDENIRYYVADEWNTDLPDNGEFVLILRHGSDKTNHEKVEDLAGYHPNLKVNTADSYTNLWPLVGYPAPNLSNNKIAAGQVDKRVYDDIPGTKTKDGNKIDKVAFRSDNNSWTGVGYKRNAKASAQNGGTPGYPNNALLSNETQAGADPVIISEIMYATGDRGNIPQWIELRNTSQTNGVNLDGWRITIVNHDQNSADAADTYPGDLVKNYNISGKIPPGQTFLVVAHSGTDNTNLPSERIAAIGQRRGDLIMSQYGFEITVAAKEKDGSRKVADKVGNLATGADARVRGNPQSYAEPAWMLPAGTNADGDRVSIVRASKDGKFLGGLDAEAWKSFDMSSHLNAPESTYYGNRNDLASPGYTVDGVLPVSLSKFRPERLATGEVAVRWITESETNNAGFNILRGEALDGEFTKLNTQLIAGQGTTSERTAYEFVDKTAKPNVVYYYQIQDVSLDGDVVTLKITHMRGNISVVGKLTTTWGELKALQ